MVINNRTDNKFKLCHHKQILIVFKNMNNYDLFKINYNITVI